MNRTLLALTLALIGAPLLSAPAPEPRKAKPAPILQVENLDYDMIWAGRPWRMQFSGNGCQVQWVEAPSGARYWGSYEWDRKTRTLTVGETTGDGKQWWVWSAVLDANLACPAIESAEYGPCTFSLRKRVK